MERGRKIWRGGGRQGGGEERQSHSEFHSVEPILVLPAR